MPRICEGQGYNGKLGLSDIKHEDEEDLRIKRIGVRWSVSGGEWKRER